MTPSTGTVSVTKSDVPVLAPNPATVDPTVRPERTTSIVHERGRSLARTTKLTCSAGIPWFAICGLYGSRVAVTEVTFTTRFPDVAGGRELPEADLGVEPHAAHDAPAINAAVRTDHARTTRLILLEQGHHELTNFSSTETVGAVELEDPGISLDAEGSNVRAKELEPVIPPHATICPVMDGEFA